MLKSAPLLVGMLLVSGAICGCQGTARPVAHSPMSPTRDAFAAQQARQAYIDSHYKQQLRTGRAANEKEAKALAASEWEAHERHRFDGDGRNANWSVTWSSEAAAKRRQQEFEEELEDLNSK